MSGAGWLFALAVVLALLVNFLPKLVIDQMTSAARRADRLRAEELGFENITRQADELNWEFVESYGGKRRYITLACVLFVLTCGWFAFADGQFSKVQFWFYFLFLNLELIVLYRLIRYMAFGARDGDGGNVLGGAPRSFRSIALGGCSGCIVIPATLAASSIAALAVIGAFNWLLRAIG